MASKRIGYRGKSGLSVKKLKAKRKKCFTPSKNKIVLKDFLQELEEKSTYNNDDDKGTVNTFDNMALDQNFYSSDTLSNWSEVEEFESDSDIYNNTGVPGDKWLSTPQHNWIIDTKNLEECLRKVALCKICHSELSVLEDQSYRDGLATKIHLKCTNESCISFSPGFFTSNKNGTDFEMSSTNIQNKMCGTEGKLDLDNLCDVIGLAKPLPNTSLIEPPNEMNINASMDSFDVPFSECGYNLSMESIIDESSRFDRSYNELSVNHESTSLGEISTNTSSTDSKSNITRKVVNISPELNYCKSCCDLTSNYNFKNEVDDKNEMSMMEFLSESYISSDRDSELSMLEFLNTLKKPDPEPVYKPTSPVRKTVVRFYELFTW